jgi:hypothetical protein
MQYFVEQCEVTGHWCVFEKRHLDYATGRGQLAMLGFFVNGHAVNMANDLNECYKTNPIKLPKWNTETWRYEWTEFYKWRKANESL